MRQEDDVDEEEEDDLEDQSPHLALGYRLCRVRVRRHLRAFLGDPTGVAEGNCKFMHVDDDVVRGG